VGRPAKEVAGCGSYSAGGEVSGRANSLMNERVSDYMKSVTRWGASVL
jgi:hypothetical protein